MAFYLGGSNPYAGMFGGGASNPLRPGQENPSQPTPQPLAPRGSNPTNPLLPGQETPQPGSPAATPPNMLGPQALRPTGPSQGFDPAYLQNLVTTIGGLFSRPQGNLSFNPLGDLSQSTQTTGFGNAPVPGLPSTMLQDALNGMGFAFQPQAPAVTPNRPTIGNSGNGGARNPRLANQL